jgi:hypothetical protein
MLINSKKRWDTDISFQGPPYSIHNRQVNLRGPAEKQMPSKKELPARWGENRNSIVSYKPNEHSAS